MTTTPVYADVVENDVEDGGLTALIHYDGAYITVFRDPATGKMSIDIDKGGEAPDCLLVVGGAQIDLTS